MTRAYALACLALAAGGCASESQTAADWDACEAQAREGYSQAATLIVASGLCDSEDKVETCPAYIGATAAYLEEVRRCQ